jgi:predicted RNA-binding Zn-ribbon protein involved in translation (DUF1610 family)
LRDVKGGGKIPAVKKKGGSKSPRFFCEGCGSEVPLNAKTCPQCGKFFSSVKCPSCGFIGEEGLFRDGCPVCGYSAVPPEHKASQTNGVFAAGPLPLWVYVITILGLGAVLFSLFFFI